MISKSYNQNKEQVLSLYNEFVQLFEQNGIQIGENIRKQADKIRNEVFNLMVLGEAKSGKSTFINAFLGKEIVPMDVLQCTSAIIEIKRGTDYKLTAYSAAGGESLIVGEHKIAEFLKAHAAIPDKYRKIPATTINNELLIKYRDRDISTEVLQKFLCRKEIEEANIYKLPISDYHALINDYITENKPNWGKIIVRMVITAPLSEAMQGITIIDSPGIGAGGNVGVIAENYVDNANAIIFVKSAVGSAPESSFFVDFIRNKCPKKKKDNLFLVFTGRTGVKKSQLTSLQEQVYELYEKDIEKDKIIFVDSLYQLYLNKCLSLGNSDRIDSFMQELEELDDSGDASPIENDICSLWRKSRGEISNFMQRINDRSNYDAVRKTIECYARIAYYLQLIEFIDNLINEYDRQISIKTDALRVADENKHDAVALEDRINAKKEELDDVFVKISEGMDAIYTRYTDNIFGDSIIVREAEALKDKFVRQLENFCVLPSDSVDDFIFDKMKKITLDALDESQCFRREMAQRIINDCNAQLISYSDDPSKIPVQAFKPNFTGSDFDEINLKAKKNSTTEEQVEIGSCFNRRSTTVEHYDKTAHVKYVANVIAKNLDEKIIPDLKKNLMAYISECREVYSKKLNEHRDTLTAEYNKLLEIKGNNDRLLAEIKAIKDLLTLLKAARENVYDVKGELKNYVGH